MGTVLNYGYEGEQPRGYITKARDGYHFEVWGNSGLLGNGWKPTHLDAEIACNHIADKANGRPVIASRI